MDQARPTVPEKFPSAGRALALLLAINLFNYIDRYILAAVEPLIASSSASARPAPGNFAGNVGRASSMRAVHSGEGAKSERRNLKRVGKFSVLSSQ